MIDGALKLAHTISLEKIPERRVLLIQSFLEQVRVMTTEELTVLVARLASYEDKPAAISKALREGAILAADNKSSEALIKAVDSLTEVSEESSRGILDLVKAVDALTGVSKESAKGIGALIEAVGALTDVSVKSSLGIEALSKAIGTLTQKSDQNAQSIVDATKSFDDKAAELTWMLILLSLVGLAVTFISDGMKDDFWEFLLRLIRTVRTWGVPMFP